MSSISSTIRINDGMSPAVRSMNRALNIVINSFERMQSLSSSAIDVADINAARTELNNASAAMIQYEEHIAQAGNEQERLTRETEKTNNKVTNLTKKITGMVAAYASIQSLGKLINLSDKVTQTDSRLNLIVDVDAGESLKGLEQKIFASAQRSRADYLSTADSVAKLANNAGNAFSSNDEIIAFLEAVNKQFVISGTEASAASGAMIQLTQGLAAGALRGDELNSVLEGAPGIARAIETHMGWVQGSIKTYAEQGLVTAQVVKNAMLSSAEEIDNKFSSMPMTWGQVFTSLGNNAIKALDPVLSKINELANNKKVQQFAMNAVDVIGKIGIVAIEIFEIIASVGNFIADNWSVISPIIIGAAAAFAVYEASLLLARAAQIKAAIATKMMTIAQQGLNAVLKASPVARILMILIAIVSVISAVVAMENKVAGTTYSVTGVIVGLLTGAVAVIWNLFSGLFEMVLGFIQAVTNVFIDFGNFFYNIFSNPIFAIIHLFQGLLDVALSVIEKIATAIDFVFGSHLAETVSNWRTFYQDFADDMATGYSPDYKDIIPNLDMSLKDFRVERIDYEDAVVFGYNLGEKISNSIPDIFNFDGFDDTANLLSSISYDTSSISDNLEMTEEDLKYLRDLAEQETINRFTTAEIKIDMGGITNQVNSNTDLDGMVEYLEDKLFEAASIAAEGVHE